LHAKGVYSFAGEDPQTFSGLKPPTAQQTLSALRAVIRHFRAMGKLGVAGEVRDPQAKIGLRPAAPSEAIEDGADRIHQVVALGPSIQKCEQVCENETSVRRWLLQAPPDAINTQAIGRTYWQQINYGQEAVHERECPGQMPAQYTQN